MDLANDISETILEHEIKIVNPKRENSHIYIKKINDLKTPRSIVLENFESHFEIVSIHVMKEKDYLKYKTSTK